ncbi:MAG TPA: hypothetical protein PLZ57_11470 [Pseudobdellovibrionaceae bacterium]|nr:hypothetical protein [Pseudobdellovibrionaceae bacterium]
MRKAESMSNTTTLSPTITSVKGASAVQSVMDQASLRSQELSQYATRAYHELAENPHIEVDGLQRLQMNLATLEDLQGRLRFMMRELNSLTRR